MGTVPRAGLQTADLREKNKQSLAESCHTFLRYVSQFPRLRYGLLAISFRFSMASLHTLAYLRSKAHSFTAHALDSFSDLKRRPLAEVCTPNISDLHVPSR